MEKCVLLIHCGTANIYVGIISAYRFPVMSMFVLDFCSDCNRGKQFKGIGCRLLEKQLSAKPQLLTNDFLSAGAISPL